MSYIDDLDSLEFDLDFIEEHSLAETVTLDAAGRCVDKYYSNLNLDEEDLGIDPVQEKITTADAFSTPSSPWLDKQHPQQIDTSQYDPFFSLDELLHPLEDNDYLGSGSSIDGSMFSVPTTPLSQALMSPGHSTSVPSTSRTSLSTHSKVTCSTCKKQYSPDGLPKHIRRMHTKKSAHIHRCRPCGKSFYQLADLRSHLNTIAHKQDGRTVFLCPEPKCPWHKKGYSKRWSTVRHIKREHGWMCVAAKDNKYGAEIKPEYKIEEIVWRQT